MNSFTSSRYIQYALNDPFAAIRYFIRSTLLWNLTCSSIRKPKILHRFNTNQEIYNVIKNDLITSGINVVDYIVDIEDYHNYLNKANYNLFSYYNRGKDKNFIEKTLEHYIAARFLNLDKDDIYIDIANDDSPVPEIYSNISGCISYRQDLKYPAGIHDHTIGGDAGQMPLPDSFASKMALHCSFEHFEGQSDINFIIEADRILKPNGKLCITPLYLADHYYITTDPAITNNGVCFDNDAVILCLKWWKNRHGRTYDVPHLKSRIIDNTQMRLTIFYIKNICDIDSTCYMKYVALFEKFNSPAPCK